MSSLDTKKSRLLPFAGVLVLALSIFIILFSGASGITQVNIEQHLQRFASYVSQEAGKSGREGKFTYGPIHLEGWGFNKHATVDNAALELSEKAPSDVPQWALSTAKLLVEPDQTAPNGFIFVFPEPINVLENGQLKTTVTFSAPLQYVFIENKSGQSSVIEHALRLPNQITLTSANTADNASIKAKSIVIKYAENPLFHIKIMPDIGGREGEYKFSDVRIDGGDGSLITASSIASQFSEKPGKDNRPEGTYILSATDLALHSNDKATKAYNVAVNLNYSGDKPGVALENVAATAGNTDMTINHVEISTDNFKVKGEGKFSTASDDPLPFGSVNVDIDNVPNFLASDLVPEQARKAVAAALQKVTGQPAETLVHAIIPMKREKNGVFYVGDSTFEALATSMLAEMLKPLPKAAPETPVAPAPDAAAAPAPDDSAPAPKNGAEEPKAPAQGSM